MAIKQGALVSRMDGSDPEAFARHMLQELFHYHGMAVGHFTGDECVMGDSPVRALNCAALWKPCYSYEQLLAISAIPLGDFLERLAFNALPATLSADMWTHQYDQQTNQVQCALLPKDRVIFGTNGPDSHLFGLEPNIRLLYRQFQPGLAQVCPVHLPALGKRHRFRRPGSRHRAHGYRRPCGFLYPGDGIPLPQHAPLSGSHRRSRSL